MFTQCPDCKTSYPLGADPVPGNHLLAYCNVCQKEFNALAFLNASPVEQVVASKADIRVKQNDVVKAKSKAKKKRKSQHQAKNKPVVDVKIEQQSASEPILPLVSTLNQLMVTSVIPDGLVPLQPAEELAHVSPSAANQVPLFGPSDEEVMPWEVSNNASAINWRLGTMLGVLLLAVQFIYFEADDLSQSLTYRPYMEKIGHWLGCDIADYRNLNEFEVLKGSFTESGNHSITFKAVINNQAPFKQKLPNIKLTLFDYEGRIFAQRLFKAGEYLANIGAKKDTIGSDESLEVLLNISTPQTSIGGYNFDLTF